VKELLVQSRRREEMLDVSPQVKAAVRETGLAEGVCLVYSPHTTCAVTVNEGYDPAVMSDTLSHLRALVPREAGFEHAEGNSDSHIKSMLVGPSVLLPVSGGELSLGHWQAVFMCEFDGPPERTLMVVVR
jgi:secondary thiamine-phosphate synthase enzyme